MLELLRKCNKMSTQFQLGRSILRKMNKESCFFFQRYNLGTGSNFICIGDDFRYHDRYQGSRSLTDITEIALQPGDADSTLGRLQIALCAKL